MPGAWSSRVQDQRGCGDHPHGISPFPMGHGLRSFAFPQSHVLLLLRSALRHGQEFPCQMMQEHDAEWLFSLIAMSFLPPMPLIAHWVQGERWLRALYYRRERPVCS